MSVIDSNPDLALPKGSLILVTGASGFVASNIVKEALLFGYRVRGTVRSSDKATQTRDLFDSPDYETAIVADLAEEGAFEDAVKGCDAIIHAASILTFSPNPNDVIPGCVSGAVSIMNSAMKESKVKRFVFTSSSAAATLPKHNQKFKITRDSWNDEAVTKAWEPAPYEPSRAYAVYAASKTEAERAVWQFVREKKPDFVVNCVLPNLNLGRVLSSPGPSGHLVPQLLRGDVPEVEPQYMINVVDDARIHVAAAIDKSLTNERILAFDSPWNWTAIIDAVQKARPNAKLPARNPDEAKDLSEPDNALGAQLLQKWFGQKGYKGLEQSVVDNLEGIA